MANASTAKRKSTASGARKRVANSSGGGGSKSKRRILNILPSKNTDRDWDFANAVDAEILTATRALPVSRDLREKWWTIADQGETGSCVGWATADSVLRWMFVKAGKLKPDELLSPRFVWMAAKETDEFISQPTTFIEDDGTSLKAALDIVRKYGCVQDSILPFKTGTLYPNPAKTFYAMAAKLKIASYFNLGNNVGNWRTWLATKGPILTRLNVDVSWDNATANKGILDVYHPETARGGHAVALVGYTKSAFIVRNSWGTSWGDKGFAYASWSYAQAAFSEAYGVSL